jgi:hypothetical protein
MIEEIREGLAAVADGRRIRMAPADSSEGIHATELARAAEPG